MRVQPADPTCSAGSGKTTLLNSLAGQVPRQERLHLSGRVLVNGLPSGHAGHRQGYVQQEDLFYSQLTVKWAFCDFVAVYKHNKLQREHCVLHSDTLSARDSVLPSGLLCHMFHLCVC